jgi:hypothetical protein
MSLIGHGAGCRLKKYETLRSTLDSMKQEKVKDNLLYLMRNYAAVEGELLEGAKATGALLGQKSYALGQSNCLHNFKCFYFSENLLSVL